MLTKFILITIFIALCEAEVDITKGPPPYDKPWVAAWGYNKSDPIIWNKHHLDMIKQTEQNKDKIRVVFFGDSKTFGWNTEGKPIWDQYYTKRGAFNYGIRGDSTRQILWRLENKELDGLSPKLLVFMIGGNNFANNYNRGTDEEIVKAMKVIVEKLRHNLPNSPIIFVGQLPRTGATDVRAKDVNRLLEEYFKTSTDKTVHFVNYYNKYVNSDGTQNETLYISDGIHINEQGYKTLAESLEPTVKQLLQEN